MTKIKSIKQPKTPKEFHTANTKIPSGSYMGTAIKNKTGSIHGAYSIDGTNSKAKSKKPKNLA